MSVTKPKAFMKMYQQENPSLILMDSEMDDPGVQNFLEGALKSGSRVPGILYTTYSDANGFCPTLVDDIVI